LRRGEGGFSSSGGERCVAQKKKKSLCHCQVERGRTVSGLEGFRAAGGGQEISEGKGWLTALAYGGKKESRLHRLCVEGIITSKTVGVNGRRGGGSSAGILLQLVF